MSTIPDHLVLHGIGVSAGTSSGPAVLVVPAPGADANEPGSTDAAADGQRVRDAMKAVSDALLTKAEHAPETSKPILETTAQLARDKGLAKSVDKELKKGVGITKSVHNAVEEYAAMLTQLGGYMAERVTDLYDIRDRTICELRGLPAPGVPDLTVPSVLVAHDLAPAETATLSKDLVLGIVTSAGGPTSHTAILAAQLAIPAVVQTQGSEAITPGTTVALDGGVGEVIISPTDEEVELLVERSRRRVAALAGSSGEGATKDGHKIKLLANIGTADDARKAATYDLEGSGLFRTEFLFLERDQAPTLAEQTKTYTEVLEAFGERRVVVRTLDAGADKPLAFADLGPEENPALGRRGLRLSMVREDLLDTQLQALAAAYEATGKKSDLRVMAPMVATMDEAKWFADKVRPLGLPKVGIMVEIPSAAIQADKLLSIVDFVSIGTNDLSQYTLAADRMQGALAPLLSPWQPALLTMVRSTCIGGHATGKPVGVCGEAGGDPLLALVLVGLGVSSLSMAPSKVATVRAALRLHDYSTCQQMANYAVDAPSAKDAKAAVEALMAPALHDLL
ncbi:phosphoenolpyruvate--protein phosphotransferase [Propionimicrobium sp. PCR01-08-3]|uniref:phosphoenolpyruvate--protein phosphotransferase n=1 Tax=Propionimicrobium sp. PCR01-08-3 TaxID=3052086 RepID=UPI00255C7AA5|nr:phosphoenolpyruvate--protein phosphotransferase [Propionimicrobium sp. PCR01-08-3]WIY83366.1 phosphoenolpyruvate--protein phosphotransferase [Propionimicrobium sp. PCR01-08-3]